MAVIMFFMTWVDMFILGVFWLRYCFTYFANRYSVIKQFFHQVEMAVHMVSMATIDLAWVDMYGFRSVSCTSPSWI